jgi:hypothetical protein
VILKLAWKEIREHRSIWLTMVFMTGVLSLAMARVFLPRDMEATGMGLTVLAMAATYGLVCGAMMFAGEWEAGTMTFLDIFLGRRGLLWFGKALVGVPLAVSEGLAVAAVLHFFQLQPPAWLPPLVGMEVPRLTGAGVPAGSWPAADLWYLALPALTLEAYAWGLFGSSFTRRVLSGAGLAALLAAPLWLFASFAPPGAFVVVRLVAAAAALVFSVGLFVTQERESLQGPPPKPDDPHPMKIRLQHWEGGAKFDLERRAPHLARPDRPPPEVRLPLPEDLTVPGLPARPVRRLTQARSPGQVLLWLTLRQAQTLLWSLAGVGLLVGFFIPAQGQALWPAATLLLGVACGTAAFAQEQRDLSYQFLGTQHLPLEKFWNAKILFWLTAALLLALVALAGGLVVVIGNALFAPLSRPPGVGEDPFGIRGPPAAAPPGGFEFGPLPGAMGPVLFALVWLVYGFCLGQVFVLFCRKNVLAVLLASLVGAAAVGLWLPSLLCQGMAGWQVWLPPLALLAATRLLMRAWAGGRMWERRPLAAMTGIGVAALAWVLVNYGFRAWEIPDVGEPLDREAFRASVPSGADNQAGAKIQEAVAALDAPPGQQGLWLARMAEAARLPLGVIERPSPAGMAPTLTHLPGCRKIAERLAALAQAERGQGNPGRAFEHLAQMLALSRNLRNKAPALSYLSGVEIEADALDGLDRWLAAGKPDPDLLRRVLDELNRHAARTPPVLDCLQTECYRAGGALDNPPMWAFYSGPGRADRTGQRWLAGAIALSLEMPWEKERKTRLWRAVWAGLFRAVRTPYAQLPSPRQDPRAGRESTRLILRGWLPAADGPGSSLTAERLARLLDASWLSDEQLFAPVVPLRAAATRARWRVDACRLAVALALYQLQEGRPAVRLEDLVPKYLPQLPPDPYSGQPFRYRISKGENVEVPADEDFQGRKGPEKGRVLPGQGVLWSTGPDRVDDGGRRHGGRWGEEDSRWPLGGFDLITVVPYWP